MGVQCVIYLLLFKLVTLFTRCGAWEVDEPFFGNLS